MDIGKAGDGSLERLDMERGFRQAVLAWMEGIQEGRRFMASDLSEVRTSVIR